MSDQQRQQKQTHSDALSQYLDLRSEYLASLREHDLVDVRGQVRPEIVDGLFGGAMIPVEGSPLDRHCQEHPEDPICQVATTGEMVEQYLDVRSEFIGKIVEHGLEDIQRFVVGLDGGVADGKPLPLDARSLRSGLGVDNAGLVGPDQDIDDVPPWLRPYVNPRRFGVGNSGLLGRGFGGSMDLSADRFGLGNIGAVGNAGLVGPDQDLDDFPRWLWPYINPRSVFSDGTPVPLPFRRVNAVGRGLLF